MYEYNFGHDSSSATGCVLSKMTTSRMTQPKPFFSLSGNAFLLFKTKTNRQVVASCLCKMFYFSLVMNLLGISDLEQALHFCPDISTSRVSNYARKHSQKSAVYAMTAPTSIVYTQ